MGKAPMKLNRLWGFLSVAILFGGCTRHHDIDIIRLPCGPGELVVHERYTRHFSYGQVSFELRFVEGRKHRLVDTQRPHISLYTRPEPEEDYHVLRPAVPDQPSRDQFGGGHLWAVFVDPNQFTRDEYARIRQTLAGNLAAIDAALARKREPLVSSDSERRPVLVSTRYVDAEARRKIYTGPKPLRIEVQPEGRVRMVRPERTSDGQTTTMRITSEIGLVTDDGRRVLLRPVGAKAPWTTCSMKDVALCKDTRGRTLLDDFTVVTPGGRAEYDEADARLSDRESEFHELTTTYVKTFRHPSRPLTLRVTPGNMMVVVGTVMDELIVRDFGRVVDGGTTVLVPGPGTTHEIIHAFRLIPGITDRRAFAAECTDEQGRSVVDVYRLVLASSGADYERRVQQSR
jgi:hypothetical protein